MITNVTKEAKDVDRLNISDLLNHAVYDDVCSCSPNSSAVTINTSSSNVLRQMTYAAGLDGFQGISVQQGYNFASIQSLMIN